MIITRYGIDPDPKTVEVRIPSVLGGCTRAVTARCFLAASGFRRVIRIAGRLRQGIRPMHISAAEDRAGQLLREMSERGERRAEGGDQRSGYAMKPGLFDLGVTKIQSHRWQAFAALAEAHSVDEVKDIRDKAVAMHSGPCDLMVCRRVLPAVRWRH